MEVSPTRKTRRRFTQLAAGAALALIPGLLPGEAGAFRRWCKTDPQITIDGQKAHIYIAAYVKNLQAARRLSTTPINVLVEIPAGISYKKLHGNNGFGYGYLADVDDSTDLEATDEVVPVRVTVTVPMSKDEIKVKSYLVPAGHGRLRPGEGHGTSNVEFSYTAE